MIFLYKPSSYWGTPIDGNPQSWWAMLNRCGSVPFRLVSSDPHGQHVGPPDATGLCAVCLAPYVALWESNRAIEHPPYYRCFLPMCPWFYMILPVYYPFALGTSQLINPFLQGTSAYGTQPLAKPLEVLEQKKHETQDTTRPLMDKTTAITGSCWQGTESAPQNNNSLCTCGCGSQGVTI